MKPFSDRLAKTTIGLGLLAGAAAAAFRKLPDPDLPWHLAVGRAVLSTHSFLPGDAFSFTFPGKYVPYEYLSDVVLYMAHRVSPSLGLHVLLLLCVLVLLRLMRSPDDRESFVFGGFVLALSLIALGPWLLVRPATLGFPILAGEMFLIERHRKSGDRRFIFALIPLQILWANVHGFAIIGAGIIALYAIVSAEKDRRIAAAAVVATCLCSFGPGIFLGPLRIADHSRFLTEWTPASYDLLIHYDPAVLALMGLSVAAAVRSRDIFSRVLIGIFMAASLLRFRLTPVFIVVSAPLIVRELWPYVRGKRSLPCVAAAAALVAPFGLMAQQVAPLGTGFDPSWLPVAACDYAEAHHLEGPVWNNLAFGGYLIWRFPDRKVFIDGRTAYLYPIDFMERAWKAETDPAAFADLDGKYHFAWAMTDARGGPFGLTLAQDHRWTMVYLDDRAAIYVKKDGPDGRLAPAGYQMLRHLTTGPDLLAAPPPMGALRHDVKLALAQSPTSLHVLSWSAALARLEAR
ncbi:MAG: hypothetical protein KGJ84_10740 [Elusimicrobia bacterium]|nr:hypothetical protein [Elusimicrobiota bacterium]